MMDTIMDRKYAKCRIHICYEGYEWFALIKRGPTEVERIGPFLTKFSAILATAGFAAENKMPVSVKE